MPLRGTYIVGKGTSVGEGDGQQIIEMKVWSMKKAKGNIVVVGGEEKNVSVLWVSKYFCYYASVWKRW